MHVATTTDAIRFYSEGLAKLRTYDNRAALDLLQKAVAADPKNPSFGSLTASADGSRRTAFGCFEQPGTGCRET